MTKDKLARLLAAAILLPTTLAIASCTPCPYTEVLESKDIALDEAAACDTGQFLCNYCGGHPLQSSACPDLCGSAKYNQCRLEDAYTQAYNEANPSNGSGAGGGGGAGGGSGSGITCPMRGATLTCQVTEGRGEYQEGCPISGRRPPGLVDVSMDHRNLGRYFASSAYFEAASVIAFERLRDELAQLGAPADLLEDLAHAARDEVRHAAQMKSLAETYGGVVAPIAIHPIQTRSALDIALENASEGLVNETFAAATALFQVRHAQDPEIRRTMARIADDECGHAALALRIADFLNGCLDPRQRKLVEERRRQAIDALTASLHEPSAEVRSLAGVPTKAEATWMHRQLHGSLWHSDERCLAPFPQARKSLET